MNNAYNEVLEKLTETIFEQLDVPLERVTLNANFYNDLDADELEIVELIMSIEEAFEVEISDEEAEKLYSVESVLDFLLYEIHGIMTDDFKKRKQEEEDREIKRLQEEKEREIKILNTLIFKFLNGKDINQEIVLKLLESDEIKSNWEKISEFVKVVDQKSFTISEIAKYSFIFQNDFILSNVETLYKIVQFLEKNNIKVNEIIFFINDGEIEKIKNEMETIKTSIEEKKDLIIQKQVKINHKKSEIQSLEQIIQNLNEEIRFLQAELNEFL